MNLSLTLTTDELQIVLDSLGEMLLQVDRAEQPTVQAVINRVRVAAGLPEELLGDPE